MNNEVYLFDVLPDSTSIYDQVSDGAEWPTTDSRIYDLAVQLDEGLRLFFQTVPPLGYYPSDMYNTVLYNVSLDTCAEYCYTEYNDW